MPAPRDSSPKKKVTRVSRQKDSSRVSHGVDLKTESPKIRQMEKKAAHRKGFRWAMGIITLICLAALLKITLREAFLKNPQFSLRQIVVRTEGPLTAQKIVRATALTEGANLLTINMREVRSRIDRLPQVRAVKIERDYSGILSLEVKQRQPQAWLECSRLGLTSGKSASGCLLDADRVPFPCDTVLEAYTLLPVIRYEGLSQNTPGMAIPDIQLKSALTLLDELQKRFEQGTEEVRLIDIQTPYSMVATFADHSQVTFGIDDLDFQLARLDRVRHEARQRQWQIESLNLLARQNVPVTFRQAPDLAGLQNLQVPISTTSKQTPKTVR